MAGKRSGDRPGEGLEIELITPTTGPHRGPAGRRGQTDQPEQAGRRDRLDQPDRLEPADEPADSVHSSSNLKSKRRWWPVMLLGLLGGVIALGWGGDRGVSDRDLAESNSQGDPASQEGTTGQDGNGSLTGPESTDRLLPTDVQVGPDEVELVAPLGDGAGGPLVDRNGQTGGPANYSAVVAFGEPDGRMLDLATGRETILLGQYSLLLATDDYLLSWGSPGAVYLAALDAVDGSEPRVESLELSRYWSEAFPADRASEFWLVAYTETGPVLQLRRLPEGEVIQEFTTEELEWNFSGGIPIGSKQAGGIYELSPGTESGLRRVADAELVAADPGRALVRSCDEERTRCDYQWLSRANWAPLDLPVPAPDLLDWRIDGGGRWLISDTEDIRLIELSTGRTLVLDFDAATRSVNDKVVSLSSDGKWLALTERTASVQSNMSSANARDTQLVIVNLNTGNQFRTPLAPGSRLLALIETPTSESAEDAAGDSSGGTEQAGEPLAASTMVLPGFRADNGQAPQEAVGTSILVAGWLGTGGILDLASGETTPIGGLAEIKLMTETHAIGLSPANDLVSVDLSDGSVHTRHIGDFANLAVLPGQRDDEFWLATSNPNVTQFTSDLFLLDRQSLELKVQDQTQILSWHAGGEAPLGTSLSDIFEYGDDGLQLVHRGTLAVAQGQLALVWECQEDRVFNGDPESERDDCGFAWRDRSGWQKLDFEIPEAPAGVGGIFGSRRWLLSYSGPNDSVLTEIETGRSIAFGKNWLSFFDVSPDGRWAIYRDPAKGLVLTDLNSAVFDDSGQSDHGDLVSYTMPVSRKIASLRFLPEVGLEIG